MLCTNCLWLTTKFDHMPPSYTNNPNLLEKPIHSCKLTRVTQLFIHQSTREFVSKFLCTQHKNNTMITKLIDQLYFTLVMSNLGYQGSN